jgi:hypothetical protein
MSDAKCTTCYGSGEVVTDHGATVCPDCFGDGTPPGRGAKVEWRLRALDQQYAAGGETGADVRWLIHELRKSREALVHILTLCQDSAESSDLLSNIQFRANDALGLYEQEPAPK